MRPWVALTRAIATRLFSAELLRLGDDILLRRSGMGSPESRAAMHALLHREALSSALAAARPTLVVDVGANRGQFGLLLRRLGYAGRMLSLEPAGGPYAVLAQAAAADPSWTALRIAAGAWKRAARFHTAREDQFSSFLPRSPFSIERFGQPSESVREDTIQIDTLESILSGLGVSIGQERLFVKLDTQGFDLEAFRGLGTFVRSVALLQSEVSVVPIYEGSPHITTSLEEFRSAGLQLLGLYPVAWDKVHLGVIEYDCLLARKDATEGSP